MNEFSPPAQFRLARVGSILVAVFLVLPAAADEKVDRDKLRRYADVESWTASVQYVIHDDWDEPVGAARRSGGQSEHGTLMMTLDQKKVTTHGVEWRGTGTTHASVSVHDKLASPGGGYQWAWSSAGAFEPPNNWLEIDFDKGVFRSGAGGARNKEVPYLIQFSRGNASKATGYWIPNSARLIEDEPAPEPGSGLSGSRTSDPQIKQVRTIHLGSSRLMQRDNAVLTVSWTFAPVWRDIELEVTIDDYDKWLPHGNYNERLAGNTLKVHAELKSKENKPLHLQARKIMFELVGASNEPGVCMNWPGKESLANEPFDLRFSPENNPNMTLKDDKFQQIATTGGKRTRASAVVTCYDWGAWADLKASAELEDGRVIVGHLKDKPQMMLVPIPRRQPHSYIADAWKEKMSVALDADDASDDDKSPGSNHDGDGFSLYEEYRGFFVNGRHIRTDPRVKDLFIFDTVGGQAVRGFNTFRNGTGIAPHWQLRQEEFRANRVMNYNRSGRSPRLYDEPQHGLKVRMWDNPLISHILTDGAGPTVPKHVEAVELSPKIMPYVGRTDAILRDSGLVLSDVTGGIIAHELSHACSVWHHGEGDLFMRLWRRDSSVSPPVIREYPLNDDLQIQPDPANPERTDPGKVIRVFGENKAEYLAEDSMFDQDWTLYVATHDGGQHSGDEACYMRYAAAGAYTRAKNPDRFRVIVPDGEVKGTTLCTSPVGTGVNLSSRQPWPRYGNASKKASDPPAQRGNCRSQVNLRDSSVP